MATGTYGTIRPADCSPEDVEILMNFTPSRDVTNNYELTRLDATEILRPYFNNTATGGNSNEILGGLYNLRLPAEVFTQLGIYTLYIRPAQIRTVITDCNVLSALPNIRGIIIDLSNVPSQFVNKFQAQGLVGFRIEYLDASGSKIPNFFRIVTSNFFCEAIVQNLTNTSQKAIRYRYTEGQTNLVFCTLSPSSSPSNNPNSIPFIGQPGQTIILSNTFFNPITMEIQMTQFDLETLNIAFYGNQTKSMEDGIYTIYDTQNNIYQQYNLYEIKDDFDELLYEVKENRNGNIDFSKSFQIITQQ